MGLADAVIEWKHLPTRMQRKAVEVALFRSRFCRYCCASRCGCEADEHFDPDHWQKHAEEARAMASNLTSEAARQLLLQVAATYDRLAIEASKRRDGG